METRYTVIVVSGSRLIVNAPFREEGKARKYYAECLLRYPSLNVELITPKQ